MLHCAKKRRFHAARHTQQGLPIPCSHQEKPSRSDKKRCVKGNLEIALSQAFPQRIRWPFDDVRIHIFKRQTAPRSRIRVRSKKFRRFCSFSLRPTLFWEIPQMRWNRLQKKLQERSAVFVHDAGIGIIAGVDGAQEVYVSLFFRRPCRGVPQCE